MSEPAPSWVELIDLVAAWDGDGRRQPVRRDDVIRACEEAGDRWGARLARRLPATDGVLDTEYVDRLLVVVHGEIQRLAEEFLHGARIWRLAEPLVESLRCDARRPIRVVDLGCGTGYVVRWLASHVPADDVEWIGVDLDPVLVDTASRLAAEEGLPCTFVLGDALDPATRADVALSTGVLHHLRGDALGDLFAAHEASGAAGFVHVDLQPSWLAPLGSWLFHRTRMRNPIARHDGIRSAQRAYDAAHLVAALGDRAPSFTAWRTPHDLRFLPLPCVLTNLVGARRPLAEAAWDGLRRLPVRLVAV